MTTKSTQRMIDLVKRELDNETLVEGLLEILKDKISDEDVHDELVILANSFGHGPVNGRM